MWKPMTSPFLALPGFYQFLFLYLEPASTIFTALVVWTQSSWFFQSLIPDNLLNTTPSPLDGRTSMVVWQLGSCYCLLGLLSSFVFRAVRDSLPNNPIAQERILAASFWALAIADVIHVQVTILALPSEIYYSPSTWNATTMGNVPFTLLLFATRVCWLSGVGRKVYLEERAPRDTILKGKKA